MVDRSPRAQGSELARRAAYQQKRTCRRRDRPVSRRAVAGCRRGRRRDAELAERDTGAMVDEQARDRALYQALKAVDEVAAALQTHLIEEHQADPERAASESTSTNSLKLLR